MKPINEFIESLGVTPPPDPTPVPIRPRPKVEYQKVPGESKATRRLRRKSAFAR